MSATPIDATLHALGQRNLVYNADFRYFSNDPEGENEAAVPDGWRYENTGTGAALATQGTRLSITVGDQGQALLHQHLSEFPRWQQSLCGQTVSARVDLEVSAAAYVELALSDGVTTHRDGWQANGASQRSLSVNLDIATDATDLTLAVRCTTPGAALLLTRADANLGTVVISQLPCQVEGVIGRRYQYVNTEHAPPEELSLCREARELSCNESRLDSVLNGRFGRGAEGRSLLPDMRGYFSRSWDNGATTDPNAADRQPLGEGSSNSGDHVGTQQDDELIEHQHDITYSPDVLSPSGDTKPITPINPNVTGHTEPFGGDETRPKNVAELYTIKWS